MTLLNFAPPLTAAHLSQIEQLTGQAVARVVKVDPIVKTTNGQK